MKKEIFRVGVYIDDEFVKLATCTSMENAIKAKKLLKKVGWGDTEKDIEYEEEVIIEKDYLYLDSLEIDGRIIDLTKLSN